MWDPVATDHLRSLAKRLDEAGVTAHVRLVVRELWRANVERYDPEAVYDDSSTLGFTAAKNVTNRLLKELRGQNGALQPNAHAMRDNQSTVVRVGDLNVRFVKAPVARGRAPRFTLDFPWEGREGRIGPATRNAESYNGPRVAEGHEPLFDVPIPEAKERILGCKEVFAVWAGDAEGRTAGWLGLPTAAPGSWLAVERAWWDEDAAVVGPAKPNDKVDERGFADLEEAQPKILLKPIAGEGLKDG